MYKDKKALQQIGENDLRTLGNELVKYNQSQMQGKYMRGDIRDGKKKKLRWKVTQDLLDDAKYVLENMSCYGTPKM